MNVLNGGTHPVHFWIYYLAQAHYRHLNGCELMNKLFIFVVSRLLQSQYFQPQICFSK